MNHPQIIAHCWLDASQKQNLFSCLEEALSSHIDIIECDVRETKDGEFILSHDPYLPKLKKRLKKLLARRLLKS